VQHDQAEQQCRYGKLAKSMANGITRMGGAMEGGHVTRSGVMPRALLALLLLAAAALSGCASVADRQPAPPPAAFISLESDARVLFEPGADNQAEQVARLLPQAIAEVEAGHYRPFTEPVRVYVCGTEECFASHVVSRNLSAAVVPNNRLFLAPRLFARESQRLPAILTHELSHVHMGQQIGHFSPTVPAWFHEGLAAYVSHGGGAEFASEAESVQAMREGRRFEPAAHDSADSRNRGERVGLTPFLFYRQSMMFVGYLKHMAEDRFKDFLLAVENRSDFDAAFANFFKMDLATAGGRFFASELGSGGSHEVAASIAAP
jgi:hypothetical protein